MRTPKFLLLFFLGTAFMFAFNEPGAEKNVFLYIIVLTGLLALSGFVGLAWRTMKTEHAKYEVGREVLIRRTLISIVFLVSFFAVKIAHMNSSKWYKENIDDATVLFFVLFLIMWLFRVHKKTAAVAGFFLFSFIPVLFVQGFLKEAETFSVISYFMLTAIAIQGLFEKNKAIIL